MDLKDQVRLRVNLETQDDALYVGTVFLGAPYSMPAKVIFDTGSEHLTVTSVFCNNITAGKYRFEPYSMFSKNIRLEIEEYVEEKTKEASMQVSADNDMDKSFIGLSYKAIFTSTKSAEAETQKQDRCHSKAYNMMKSTSGQVISNQSTTLSYGSAELQGFLWKDYTCLQPLSLSPADRILVNSSYLQAMTD